jgi:hypothetical protein
MQSSLESFNLSVILNVIVSIMEIASRLSFRWRVELVDKLIKRMSEEERRAKYSSDQYKRHVGRLRTLDTLTEYICMSIAPLIIMVQYHNGLIIQAGYEGMTYDGKFMFEVTMVAFLMEFLTDFICWRYEDPLIDLSAAWSSMISNGRYWTILVPAFMFSVIFAGYVMQYGFAVFPDSLTNIPCHFVISCLPNPCSSMCFNATGPVEVTFDNKAMSFITSPFLDNMCRVLANNGTDSFIEQCGFDLIDSRSVRIGN